VCSSRPGPIGAVAKRRRAARIPLDVDLSALHAEISGLLSRGDHTGAVRLHRDRTGSSLQQAVQAVSDIGRPGRR
jgi:hypothetical protein